MTMALHADEQCEPKALGHASLSAYDWRTAEAHLDDKGYAILHGMLPAQSCDRLAGLYGCEELFRSEVIMQRHGFGRGRYKYFSYPLPPVVLSLRQGLYRHLAPIANRWHARLGLPTCFPASHAAFVEVCHQSGQTRPTPLLVHYEQGDYNCLHQDLYGEHVFPLQVVALLSRPGDDFAGGELVLTEQRPRMQSKATVVPLAKGDAVVFAVRHRPVDGSRGVYRVGMRHGVSEITSGRRHTMGIIFHDAQ